MIAMNPSPILLQQMLKWIYNNWTNNNAYKNLQVAGDVPCCSSAIISTDCPANKKILINEILLLCGSYNVPVLGKFIVGTASLRRPRIVPGTLESSVKWFSQTNFLFNALTESSRNWEHWIFSTQSWHNLGSRGKRCRLLSLSVQLGTLHLFLYLCSIASRMCNLNTLLKIINKGKQRTICTAVANLPKTACVLNYF